MLAASGLTKICCVTRCVLVFQRGSRAQRAVAITLAAALKSPPPPYLATAAFLLLANITRPPAASAAVSCREGWGVREFSSSVSVVKIIKERRRL